MGTKYLIKHKTIRLAAIVALALAFALTFVAQAPRAFADESSSATSKATVEEQLADATGALPFMGNDYVWFGNHMNLKGATVENDVIAAGQTIKLDECSVLGDVRVAAQTVDLADTYALQNITVAGETVTLSNSHGNAIVAASKTFAFGGSCENLTVFAGDALINGTVEGDVYIDAENVTIATDARIKGTLHVSAPNDPVMERGSEVADVDYTKAEKSTPNVDAASALTGLAASFGIMFAVLGLIATLLIALFAELLFKKHTAAAAEMIRTRTGATIGTGVVAAIVAPIAIIILCCLVVTLPIAGALTLALLAMTVVSGGFAGASLFKLAFPKMNRIPCALAGGAIVGVASVIPFLGTIVDAAAFMYLLGYVLQTIFLNTRKESPVAPMPAVKEPVTGDPFGTAPASPVAPAEPMTPVAPVTPVEPAASTASTPTDEQR